jgi:hypothetical protein
VIFDGPDVERVFLCWPDTINFSLEKTTINSIKKHQRRRRRKFGGCCCGGGGGQGNGQYKANS